MLQLRSCLLALLLVCSMTSSALAEGFAMSEWGARGLSLAGGLVSRADDVSTLSYNAAGITQLPGLNVMAGASFVAPYGSIYTHGSFGSHTTSTKPHVWVPPHAYFSYQLNDSIWIGAGIYSRFGLGNSFAEDWQGRYNVYSVGLQSVSFVPTIAYKINDMFSVSLGVELMYMSMYQGSQIPTAVGQTPLGSPILGDDNSLFLEGSGVGVGYHLGVHAKFNEQWSAGIAYKSQVAQNIYGTAHFGRQEAATLPDTPNAFDTNVHGTIYLPDSLAFGVAYKPIENLSFAVGAVWTRWSSFKELNMFFTPSTEFNSKNPKEWNDGWNFNASVEYSPLDWLTLRAGYWHETPVTNSNYADFLMPTNGRDAVSLGVGFNWGNWNVDLAYMHLWIYPTNYDDTKSSGIISAVSGIEGGYSSNVGSDIYSFSISYTF